MAKKISTYLHGFSSNEQERLFDQAEYEEQNIYKNVDFTDCKRILEVGSGVGAQTEILLRRYPKIEVNCVDLNEKQIEVAKKNLGKKEYFKGRYKIEKMNASNLSFGPNTFDGAFLCWVLEHIPDPKRVLSEIRRVLKPGSIAYFTEVMNFSFFLEPYSPNLWKYWMAFNDYQLDLKGDPFIGVKLGNLLMAVGFQEIQTRVITWHLDGRWPGKRQKLIESWKELILSASSQLIDSEYVDEQTAELAKEEMETVQKDPDAVFYYSYMQAQARAI